MPDFTPEKFLLFLAFVAPGFFAMQVYALWYPTQRKEWGSSLIEIISYSLLIYLLCSWWLIRHFREAGILTPEDGFRPAEVLNNPGAVFWALIWVGLVTPVVLASTLYSLRSRVLPWLFNMDHPARTAWDYALNRNRCSFIICTLKDGWIVGGLFAGKSYGSTYPIDAEVYIEQMWEIENRHLVRPVEDSRGMVIKIAECRTVEYFDARPANPTPSWLRRFKMRLMGSGNGTANQENSNAERREGACEQRPERASAADESRGGPDGTCREGLARTGDTASAVPAAAGWVGDAPAASAAPAPSDRPRRPGQVN